MLWLKWGGKIHLKLWAEPFLEKVILDCIKWRNEAYYMHTFTILYFPIEDV